MKALILLSILLSWRTGAEMIFVDLNDAPEEINHCRQGIEANNAKKMWQQPEELHVVKGVKGDRKHKSNTYHALRAKIADLVRRRVPIDSIVISGDDGSGKFFGTEGDFHQRELKALMEEFPMVASSLKSAALWGCYPSSVHGAEQFWVNKLPNMQFTMGFVTQGPDKTRPANHALLKQFCERRQEAAEATTVDQLCKFYDSLEQLTPTALGLCNREGVASNEYRVRGEAEKCFTYQQLHDRCPNFVDNPELMNVYDKYMSGEAEAPDEVTGEVHELRRFYNETQKWRHCADQFKHKRGYDMPFPPDIIRLIKYKKVKANLMKVNAEQLAEYDAALDRAGLGDLKLGDITKVPRKELNARIEAAIAALEGKTVEVPATVQAPAAAKPKKPKTDTAGSGAFMFGGGEEDAEETAAPPPAAQTRRMVRGVQDPTLLRMARCNHLTLVRMDNLCTAFDLVSDHPRTPSTCLMSYEEAKGENPNDAC